MVTSVNQVNLKYSDSMKNFLKSCSESNNFPTDLKNLIPTEFNASTTLSYDSLRTIHTAALKDVTVSSPKLWQLLIATEIDLPCVEQPERNPDLEKRIEKLKARFATEDYNRMTSNVSSRSTTLTHSDISTDDDLNNINWGAEIKQVNRYLLMFLNFIIVVGCSFVAGYKGVELIVPKGLNTFHVQLISGFMVSFVVFFADLYFLMKNLTESENMLSS